MTRRDLAQSLAAAEAAAEAARREIMPRFRKVEVETKADGSPVTEADRAAERAIRDVLREADPDAAILGEEYGEEAGQGGRCWVVDPIDGTIAFARGLPLFSTLIALLEDGEPVVGVIDLPGLGERYVGSKGGGVRRNGEAVRVSERSDLSRALVSHGDPYCFERFFDEPDAWQKMAGASPMLRGYTDAFGHAMVLSGGVDVMVDVGLNPWDAAATQLLIPEAGGRCVTVDRSGEDRGLGLVFGSPALVDQLLALLEMTPDAKR